MRSSQNRSALAATFMAVAVLASACGGESPTVSNGTAAPVPGSSETPSSPPATAGETSAPASTTSSGSTSEPTTEAGGGCAATNEKVPSGAATKKTFDLDGDGKPDTIWVGDGRKGVETASGAVVSLKVSNAGGPEITVFAQTLSSGAKVLMENGRQAYVSAFSDCTLVETKNVQGEQYTFDLGFNAPDTGYGCANGEDVVDLVGLALTKSKDGGTKPWLLEQTVIDVSKDGRTAENGEKEIVGQFSTKAYARAGLDQASSLNTCSPETVSQA
ncbi:hypothetical protein [Kineosporia babensis]|uniref:Secreted protein n=1 Tax=Kineosporia babensis TaxID=499548 RepID=A0A9X1NCR8_9ACTN|nr:hypothetical protein [Kineosporia babensis]MCD5310653.1 hypothetical protein [Kineosporia babensis]